MPEPTPDQIQIMLQSIESELARLKEQVKENRSELSRNSRGSLVFVGGVIVMFMIGVRFNEGSFSYAIELEKLVPLIELPAIAALIAALIPVKR